MSNSPAASADFSLRILWTLARWIEDKKGAAELAKAAAAASVRPENFDGSTYWVSHAQFEAFFAYARELAGSDEVFKEACAYRFVESYGAFRYMMWALSQQQMAEAAAKLSPKVVANVGRFEILKSERDRFEVRYRSDCAESRLSCLCRQVHWTVGPTMWGLPPTQLTEHACMAKGDEYCEYHLRWFERSRILPVILGIAAGVVAGVIVTTVKAPWLGSALLPLLGGALGYILELRRIGTLNVSFANDLHGVLRDLGQSEAETRTEIVGLHQRQREWLRLMEQQVTERTRALEKIVEGLDGLQQSRVTKIRGFSHDLRNPLFVVRGNTQFLRERFNEGEEGDALRDVELAAVQIEAMLSRLMEVATAETGFVKLAPKPLAVAPLAETFRRRLKALVHGRDIKVSVFCTREAPDEIVIDPVVFDRVVDNLLTNAAKYTDRGSILLELSGTPPVAPNLPGGAASSTGDGGFLTLKLSDTGQGIAAADVDRIFRPRSSSDEPARPNSYGVGLSSVVRLLAQIGGRLDVMSKADVGTTFWAHFPATPPAEQKRAPVGEDNLESMITRVVTIRKVEGV
jgi:signal transduction histidine kinase